MMDNGYGIVSVSYPADDAVKIYKVDCKICGAVADYDYEQDAWDRAHSHNISHGSGTILTIDKGENGGYGFDIGTSI